MAPQVGGTAPQDGAIAYDTAVYPPAVATLCSLATVVVLLRLWSRKVSHVELWWDDACIIIATVSISENKEEDIQLLTPD